MNYRSILAPFVALSTLTIPCLAQSAPPRTATGDGQTQSKPATRTTSSADLAAAEALFQEARRLSNLGHHADACPKFEESQRLDAAVGTLLYLADCYEELGQTASAWATFELAASEGRKANQTNRERMARERADALASRLSKLSIVLEGERPIEGRVILRDKTEVGEASLGVPVPVDPGKHTVTATAPKYEPWSTEVEVGTENDNVTVTIPLMELRRAGATAPLIDRGPPELLGALAPPLDYSHPGGLGAQRIAGIAVAGVGVVGLGVSAWMFVDSASFETESKRHCYPPDYSQCEPDGIDLLDDAEDRRNLGFIAGSVGLAALIGGAVLYFTAPSAAETALGGAPEFVPIVDGSTTGLGVSGVF